MALAPDTSVMSGVAFHPLAIILLMSGWCFVVFLSLVSSENMSLQYVNSKNCTVISGIGASGSGELYGVQREKQSSVQEMLIYVYMSFKDILETWPHMT